MLNFNDEIWKDMIGYEGQYQVSSMGRVRSIVDNHGQANIHIKKTYIRSNSCQYEYVCLSVKDVAHTEAVHRAVAKAFIPNPEKKPMVNHRDGNKLKNTACNLEWVTCSENHIHAHANGLRPEHGDKLKGVKWGKTSQYHNVAWDGSRQRWIASMKFNGKSNTKRFVREEDAARHVNALLDKFGIIDRARNVIK